MGCGKGIQMEVVYQVFLVNEDEVLLTLNAVLWRFPDNVHKTDGILCLYFWCA